jgi:anti-sigma-K factor RskA
MPELSDDELNALRASLGLIARSIEPADRERVAPPADLWASIDAALDQESPPPVPVVDLAARRRARRPWLGIAAAAAALVLLAGGMALSRRGNDGGVRVSSAALTNEGLSPRGSTSSGTARVVQDGSSLKLDLQVSHPPTTTGAYLEIWMIDTKVKGMVSLGPYHGNGRYPIPAGVDPAAFPVVDVSIEPADGQPTHSGISIVRGLLQ